MRHVSQLFQAVDIIHPDTGKQTATLVLGHVKYIHVRNDVLNERGIVDPLKFKPITRLGDISYANFGAIYRIPRPQWNSPEGDKIRKVIELETAKEKEEPARAGKL